MARRSREDDAKVREDGVKMGCQNVNLFLSGPLRSAGDRVHELDLVRGPLN